MSKTRYVCLRDDDTNYFTRPEELQTAYGEFWDVLPVTLAVIPFAHGSERKIFDVEYPYEHKFRNLREWETHATPEELTEYHKLHPVGENRPLVRMLSDMARRGTVEIAQHGVYHRYTEYGAELLGDRMSFTALRDGKEYLEKVFGITVKTLIPPGNVIDLTVIGYMQQLELNLMTDGHIYSKGKIDSILNYVRHPSSIADKLCGKNKPIRHRFGIYYIDSSTYHPEWSEEQLQREVFDSLDKTGFATIATHYRSLQNDSYRAALLQVLRSLKHDESVQFVTASQYRELSINQYHLFEQTYIHSKYSNS